MDYAIFIRYANEGRSSTKTSTPGSLYSRSDYRLSCLIILYKSNICVYYVKVLENVFLSAKKNIVLITPDGPTGPIYKFKAGAIVACKRAGSPLYLCGAKVKWKINFRKSWDNFLLPLPFAKIVLRFSEQVQIPVDFTREQIEEKIIKCEKRLNELSNL